MKFWIILFTALLLTLAVPAAAQDGNLQESCVTTYDPQADYFPDKVTVQAAEGFIVEYFGNYKQVTVQIPWMGAEKPLVYTLVQCGTPAPDVPSDGVIEVPARRAVAMSTSFLPAFTDQELMDVLVAVDTVLYTRNPAVITGVAAGTIAEVGGGYSGQEVNVERLIDLQPDLVLTQRFSADDTDFAVLQQAGLPMVVASDFMDTSPLGVAEWGKFISLFFNTEAAANARFEATQTHYAEIKALTAGATARPTVFAGTPYDGTWYMPGGRSYLAQLLADAGADYLWADDTSTGSLFLDVETVFDRASAADYWMNVNQFWGSLKDAEAEDSRYTGFAAFQNGQVYSNNARLNENGGSDYYESGYANPDVILADLVAILHPDLLPDYTLFYYQQIPASQP